jgi:hypothetical protein
MTIPVIAFPIPRDPGDPGSPDHRITRIPPPSTGVINLITLPVLVTGVETC